MAAVRGRLLAAERADESLRIVRVRVPLTGDCLPASVALRYTHPFVESGPAGYLTADGAEHELTL